MNNKDKQEGKEKKIRQPKLEGIPESIIETLSKISLKILEAMSEGLILLDCQGIILYANPAMEKFLGLSRKEAVGKNGLLAIQEYIHKDDKELAVKHFNTVLSGSVPIPFPLRIVTKTCQELWFIFNVSFIFDVNEKLEFIILTCKDDSEKKKSLDALRYRIDIEKLLTNISSRFLNVTRENLDMEINTVLRESGELTGVDRVYVFKFDNHYSIMSNTHEWTAEGIEPQIGNLQNLPTSSFPWWMEKLTRAQNILIPRVHAMPPEASAEKEILQTQDIRSLAVVPLYYANTLVGFLGFDSVVNEKIWSDEDVEILKTIGQIFVSSMMRFRAEDEKRALEQQLYQSQKMEAIGQLAGEIAHDFNNLLSVIKGNAELLLLTLSGGNYAVKDVETILKATNKASKIIQQLLTFSKKQILSLSLINMNKLITNSKDMLTYALGKYIEFEFQPGTELANIKADPQQIEQILMNLMVNAKDAIGENKGKLTIRCENAIPNETTLPHLLNSGIDQFVMIEVTDTGCGMDENTLLHIFEPYFTTKEKGRGTGLGLANVYGMVKQSKGYITVNSEVGKGTTFKIYFPCAEEETLPTEKPLSEKEFAPAKKHTILLVEDDEIIANLANKILVKMNYSVIVAETGEQAYDLFKMHFEEIDLLLADIILPGMNGMELYHHLVTFAPELKVVFLSGYPDIVLSKYGELKPGINFIQKPFEPEILVEKIQSLLN